MLSVIIPSYKDPLLRKTVESLLENAEGEIEIICVLDGYWCEPVADPRVKVLHLGKNRGMREAINAGVAMSSGEFIMRTDEHCMFGPGYDRILTRDCEENLIMIPRRFKLDTDKWEVMDEAPNDYDKLIIDKGHMKFSGLNWKSRAEERKDIMIDETMASRGPCRLGLFPEARDVRLSENQKTMGDLTVVFITASEIRERFAEYQRRVLREAAKGYPIISVSRKPLDFGTNILDD